MKMTYDKSYDNNLKSQKVNQKVNKNKPEAVKSKKTTSKIYFIIRWFIIIGAITAWEVTARLDLYNTFFTSYPSAILKDLVEFAASGKLARHTFITLEEAFCM